MAKTRLNGAGFRLPALPLDAAAGFALAAPAVNATICTLGTTANDKYIRIGSVIWADGGSHNLHQIRFRTGTVTSLVATGLRVSNRAVDATNGPIGRDDGTLIGKATQGSPASGTIYTLTLDVDTTYATGAECAIVIDIDTYTSGSVTFVGFNPSTAQSPHRPLPVYYNGTTYAMVTGGRMNGVTLIAADGTYGYLAGDLPCITATVTTSAINTGTTPDEVGFSFTVGGPLWAGQMGFLVNPAASADFSLVLYEDTTQKAIYAVDANTHQGNAVVVMVTAAFPDVALTTGHTYRVVVKPTTANSVSVYSLNVTDAAEALLVGGFTAYSFTSRVDAGAFSEVNTRIPWGFIGIVATDDGAGTGGGGGGKRIGAGGGNIG